MSLNLKIFKSKKEFFFFFAMLIISAVATVSVYAFKLNGPPIRSDGLGYYVYLPSIFIYKDVSMNKFIDAYSTHYNDAPTDNWNGIYKYENTGNYLDKYPIGVAVMSMPFFLVAHVSTVFLNHFMNIPPDGFSTPLYHIAQSVSGTFYALAGLLILKRILDRYFKPKVVYLTILVLTFGTNLFHYFTYDAVFSHAYSFFLFSLFVYLTLKWYSKPTKLNSILIGLTTGLITIVRPTNLVIVLFFILFGFQFTNLKNNIKDRISLFLKSYRKLTLVIISALAVVAIQSIYWYLISGKLFVYSYINEPFFFDKPEILNVLFSIRKGFFFYAPVLFFAVAGLYFLRKRIKGFIFPTVIFLAVNLYIISCWSTWSYGGSYGMRALVESLVFLSFPLAMILEKIIELKRRKLKYFLAALITIFCIFNFYMMIQYWRGFLPIDYIDSAKLMNAILNKEKIQIN